MKHLVIHKSCIDDDLKFLKLDEKSRQERLRALQTISGLEIIDEPVIYFEGHNLGDIGSMFNYGDEVMLYGAYLGKCLKSAEESLLENDITVKYHEEGCVDISY